MARRTEWVVVGPVMILGLVLRLVEAGRTYLNADEIKYFFLALGNFRQILNVGLQTDHPPLLFFLLHPVASITSSGIALRLIPVLAGVIFPWVVYRWLARVWNARAGLIALFILTLSPNLIFLSAQIRGYTIELLFAALALLFLESGLEEGSVRLMILFSLSLDLAILSEYSAAYFAGAVGIYFLLRARELGVTPRLWAVWAMGQLSALVIYAALYRISIKPSLAMRQGYIDEFLRGGFPGAHQNLLLFSALATLKQFAYAFSSIIVGIGAAVLFGAALVILWKDSSPSSRTRNRIVATLLATPFLFASTAALLRLHPYARSRHTVILCLFVAAGVGILLERVFRARPWIAGFGAVALGLFWMFGAEPDQHNIPRSRNRRTSMIAAINYLQSSVPPGSVVLANKETARYLRFYLPDRRELRLATDFDSHDGPLMGVFRVAWRRWDFGDVDDFLGDLTSVRREFGLNRDAPIWVLDGGFDSGIDSRLRKRFPGISLPEFHDFDGALTVFQTPPGM
jgi:4-amino-4-deoxy-L-arabinose transferase-like glycosyltransferase